MRFPTPSQGPRPARGATSLGGPSRAPAQKWFLCSPGVTNGDGGQKARRGNSARPRRTSRVRGTAASPCFRGQMPREKRLPPGWEHVTALSEGSEIPSTDGARGSSLLLRSPSKWGPHRNLIHATRLAPRRTWSGHRGLTIDLAGISDRTVPHDLPLGVSSKAPLGRGWRVHRSSRGNERDERYRVIDRRRVAVSTIALVAGVVTVIGLTGRPIRPAPPARPPSALTRRLPRANPAPHTTPTNPASTGG